MTKITKAARQKPIIEALTASLLNFYKKVDELAPEYSDECDGGLLQQLRYIRAEKVIRSLAKFIIKTGLENTQFFSEPSYDYNPDFKVRGMNLNEWLTIQPELEFVPIYCEDCDMFTYFDNEDTKAGLLNLPAYAQQFGLTILCPVGIDTTYGRDEDVLNYDYDKLYMGNSDILSADDWAKVEDEVRDSNEAAGYFSAFHNEVHHHLTESMMMIVEYIDNELEGDLAYTSIFVNKG